MKEIKMKIHKIVTTVLFAWFLASPMVQAAFMSVGPGSPLNLAGANGAITVTFSPSPATEIYFSNDKDDFNPQDQDHIGSVIEDTFGLASGALVNGDKVDNAGGGSSASFTSTQAYEYLAVHFGKHELLFHFANSITAGTVFSITTEGRAAGLSNFRSYSVIPIPAAVWLFGSGLLGLLGASRRKSISAIKA